MKTPQISQRSTDNRYYIRTLSDDLMEISKEEFDRYMNAGHAASALSVGHFVVENVI